MAIHIKRIYEPVSKADGYRVLVDRLWPRGITKEAAQLDKWLKEIAPSTALRQWFHKDMDNWKEFEKRYKAELKGSEALAELLADAKAQKVITLLFAAKEESRNHAQVLLQYLQQHV